MFRDLVSTGPCSVPRPRRVKNWPGIPCLRGYHGNRKQTTSNKQHPVSKTRHPAVSSPDLLEDLGFQPTDGWTTGVRRRAEPTIQNRLSNRWIRRLNKLTVKQPKTGRKINPNPKIQDVLTTWDGIKVSQAKPHSIFPQPLKATSAK